MCLENLYRVMEHAIFYFVLLKEHYLKRSYFQEDVPSFSMSIISSTAMKIKQIVSKIRTHVCKKNTVSSGFKPENGEGVHEVLYH